MLEAPIVPTRSIGSAGLASQTSIQNWIRPNGPAACASSNSASSILVRARLKMAGTISVIAGPES